MPNFLTMTRILLSVITTAIIIIFPNKLVYIVSFILFCVAGITDYFDGWYARKNNEVSELGKMLDPIAAVSYTHLRAHETREDMVLGI